MRQIAYFDFIPQKNLIPRQLSKRTSEGSYTPGARETNLGEGALTELTSLTLIIHVRRYFDISVLEIRSNSMNN